MGFGQTSLSGVRHGIMPPQLKTKQHKSATSKTIFPHYLRYMEVLHAQLSKGRAYRLLRVASKDLGHPLSANF